MNLSYTEIVWAKFIITKNNTNINKANKWHALEESVSPNPDALIDLGNAESSFNNASQTKNHLAEQQRRRLKCLFVEHKGHWGSKPVKGKDNVFHAWQSFA